MAEEEGDSLARKKRVRAAHRGSVTRIIGQVEEALESADARRLKQLRQSLTDKSAILSKLDDELIEIVEEEQLESEVEQADLVREKISLAVIGIEEALEALAMPSRSTRRGTRRNPTRGDSSHRAEISPSGSSEEEGGRSPPSHGSPSVLDSHAGPETTSSATDPPRTVAHHSALSSFSVLPSSSAPPLTTGLPLTFAPIVSSLLDAPPHSGTAPIVTMSTLPSLLSMTSSGSSPIWASSAPLVSGMPSLPLPTVYSAPSVPPLSGVMSSRVSPSLFPSMVPHPPSVVVPQVRLPKLSIRKFNGDLTRWVTFWDSFDSSIHTNPTLSSVDKFNYLISLLESSAAEAIAGLTLTSANYEEAVATLRKRFGNPQLIVDRHMEALLSVTAVSSHHDIKGSRKLHDTVEAHIRGLRALGVPAESYGGLLTSVLMNKLPPEIRLIVSREMTGRWDLDRVMRVFEQEIDARERASASSTSNASNAPRRAQPRIPTAATLIASNSGPAKGSVNCVYCGKGHPSSACTIITDHTTRKEMLRKAGRCYICLRRHHLSRDCRSNLSCTKCRGRHHVTICSRRSSEQGTSDPTSHESVQEHTRGAPSSHGNSQGLTNTLYAGAQTPILLQTAQLQLFNLNSGRPRAVARAIMDSGSQRTYITCRLRDELELLTTGTESLRIKTFGTTESNDTSCDVVQLGLNTKEGGTLKVTALVVPFICNPLASQPITHSGECYDHLLGLELADSAGACDVLEVDVLIGSDSYWDLATGTVHPRRKWARSRPHKGWMGSLRAS